MVPVLEIVLNGGVRISGPALPGAPEHVCMRTFVTPGADLVTIVDPRALALAPSEFAALHRAHLELVERMIARWFRGLEALVWTARAGGFAGMAALFGFDFRATIDTAIATTLAFGLTLLLDQIGRKLVARLVRFVVDRVRDRV